MRGPARGTNASFWVKRRSCWAIIARPRSEPCARRRWCGGRGSSRGVRWCMNPDCCCAGCVRIWRRRTMRVGCGWLEVDTVALCGGSVAGAFVWMVDAVDYATTWVELRAMWGRGQVGTLWALRDMEASLPFDLLGLDSDNGGEFLNHHVLSWLQKRPRPVFMTRSRPYKKDDNAHVEQKNWTHIRQCFGYERHDNPEVVEPMNALVKGAYGQLLNYFHASLKLERKERKEGRVRRIYAEAQTPLARVLASAEVAPKTKRRLEQEKAGLNPFALKREVARSLKEIASLRQVRP